MYFPEAFLWQVFAFLAESYLKFSTGPFRSLRASRYGEELEDGYLLHNDIKTDNSRQLCQSWTGSAQANRASVFLGSRITADQKEQWYPVAKVGDFGLSVVTHPNEHDRNQAIDMEKGTDCWYAPVSAIRSLPLTWS